MTGKRCRNPLRYCEAAFFGGLLDDPLLFVRIRPEKQALLFDCGQIAHLAKRVVKPIRAVFISHAHMDHVMGIPTLVRHHHASPVPLDIYGPEGISDRVMHLLNGFDWNLCEPSWCTIQLHEIHEEQILHYSFPGPDCFKRYFHVAESRSGPTVWSSPHASVEAEILDHKLPVLAYRLNEKPPFTIDQNRLAARGLPPGEWIRDLKRTLWSSTHGLFPAEPHGDNDLLYESIRGESTPASLGYLTDVGWTEENRTKIETFFDGITLLCVECTFLAGDEAKARESYHLCSRDINELVHRLSPSYLVPMHLSKSYLRTWSDLYGELRVPGRCRVIPLPDHIVPAPLTVEDVGNWLCRDL